MYKFISSLNLKGRIQVGDIGVGGKTTSRLILKQYNTNLIIKTVTSPPPRCSHTWEFAPAFWSIGLSFLSFLIRENSYIKTMNSLNNRVTKNGHVILS
jgi:hypothetical protein